MRGLITTLTALLAAPLGFTATAYAADAAAVPNGESLLDLAKPIYEAVMSGQWWLAAAAALILSVALLRRWAPWPWLKDGPGVALLTVGASFAGALATALAAGQAMTGGLAWMAAGVAFAAIGGYSALKVALLPALEWLSGKLPAWARPVVDLLRWILSRPTAIAKAEKKGADAVKASPGPGADSITGAPTELE